MSKYVMRFKTLSFASYISVATCRQLAIKALNERLSKVEAVNWPSIEDSETPPTSPDVKTTTVSISMAKPAAEAEADIPTSSTPVNK